MKLKTEILTIEKEINKLCDKMANKDIDNQVTINTINSLNIKLKVLEAYRDSIGYREAMVKPNLIEIHGNQYLIKATTSISPLVLKKDAKSIIWEKYEIVGFGEMTRYFNIGDIVKLWSHPIITDLSLNTITSSYVEIKDNAYSLPKFNERLSKHNKILSPHEMQKLDNYKVIEYVVKSEHDIIGKIN